MDVFSFGVVLWELVTKEMPHRGAMRDMEVPRECPQVRLLPLVPRVPIMWPPGYERSTVKSSVMF